jgi:predicted permease
MIETLFHAYTPLIVWTGLGILSFRFLPENFPRLLGRSLYWVGVPWQILALARQTDFSHRVELAPAITIATLGTGLLLAWLTLQILLTLKKDAVIHEKQQTSLIPLAKCITPKGEQIIEDNPSALLSKRNEVLPPREAERSSPSSLLNSWIPPLDRPHQGTLIIASMLGNTGFVGLGIIPALLTTGDMSWAVFFSITQNLIGTYGVGVLVASHYGRPEQPNHLWRLLRDLITVPSLWAFAIGYSTQSIPLITWLERVIDSSLLFVVPASFLLMGMRLSQLQGFQSLKVALLPVILKVILLPGLVGIGTTLLGLSGDPRLSLVLMAGMPSAFASLILAEEYDLDHDLAASSIALSTIVLLMMIPLWLALFGQ